ncbi:MAG TPA: hypothetical protein VMM18_18335 [Gemmatimonadaceae bacterium]|nr:hypothetical protein [Gemmatimonadaceae bacterium]
MSKYIRQFSTPLALALAFTVAIGGCRGDGDNLAQDTSLESDLTLAGQDTLPPQLTDVPPGGRQPAAPRPAAPRPTTPATTPGGNVVTRTPGAAAERVVTVPAGTRLNLASTARVCTHTNRVGDTFVATLSQPVTAGAVTIPAGAQARVRITQLKRSENVNDQAILAFQVEQIAWGGKTYPVTATIVSADTEQERSTSTGSDAKKVIGGAIIGAAVGQILGKDTKSTVIGAATGAAAGTAVAVATGNHEACVPQGGTIAITLNQPLEITTAD